MISLIETLLSRAIVEGSLEVVGSDGKLRRFGDGTGRTVRIRITDAATERAIILDPELKLGEAFMDGKLIVEEGSIYDFLDVVLSNTRGDSQPTLLAKLRGFLRVMTRRLRQHNTEQRARRNVAHHYDLDGALYRLFLDSDRQYSCAYFEHPTDDIEAAQLAKKRHLAAKLLLEPGLRVLDIGSGWGGLGLYLADIGEAKVTGVTLSEEQFGEANARASERRLADRAQFELRDYRSLSGPYDRIVSVGMFEHVGVGHFDEYFAKVKQLLTPDGVMVLHSIGRFDKPGDTNAWIQKYIFPGGYIPALSEVMPAIERQRLIVTDIEILRLHYAETLRAWRERFLARRDEALALYDERFCRMWEFYLAASETAFRYQDMMVFQIQLARRQEAVPLTRGYIGEAEAKLRERESGRQALRLAGE
jgi:cyclopropane-fatty-acyl-phospholipid synthase